MSGSNTIPLGGGSGGGGGRFAGGGGGGGSSLLNPSYLNQGGAGAIVPLGSSQSERKRPAERESRFDKKESREER